MDLGTEIIPVPGRGTSCPMTKLWAHSRADSAGCGTSCVSPPFPRHSRAPEGPALAVILGSTSRPPPLLGKGHMQNHVLPAPFWRGSIQKTSARAWESSPKAQPNSWSAMGSHRHGHSSCCLPAQPNPGGDTILRGRQGPHELVPFLAEDPSAHEMVVSPWQQDPADSQSRSLLSTGMSLTGGSGQPQGRRVLAQTPVPNELTLPPPSPLQMLPVLPVPAQSSPDPHSAYPPLPSPPH